MKTRIFNDTNRPVSEMGLGCWQLGGTDWGDLDDQAAFGILRAAAEAGVTFFDTADVYGNGRSETLIGRFLKEHRLVDKIFVATKVGRGPELYPDKYSEAAVRAATEASLKRLGVEALDLTQLHCVPTEILRQGEIFGWLDRLQQEGKIQRYGASVETMEEALICLDEENVCSLQIIFNLFRQKPLEEVMPRAEQQNVAIIVRLPLASGLLSGKMTADTRFAENDHRHYNRDGEKFNVGETFAGLPYEKGVELADALKQYVPEGMTMAQWSQRWILEHEAVSVVIPGASRPQQAADNAAVSELPALTKEMHAELETFYRKQVAAHIRGPY